ncbi:MAG: NAD(+) diphosphatase [Neptuniibacter caesariensis]|uniref:NAD(+) diphosphatase n=1 Tax=Neptuniibacter caesariensis TaxID=207954 RepID=A0A2G6JPJ4_NEPCE|nr:MAG: NAD(+) diphosphatase [Neptuniibacter caesariensis]
MKSDSDGYLLAYDQRLLGTASGVLTCSEAELDSLDVEAVYPLGLVHANRFKLAILASDKLPAGVEMEQLVGLRSMLAVLSNEDDYVLLSAAAQVATWHVSFKFCPRCATKLAIHSDEFAKTCPSCGHHQYPRISPCIIVLVRNGNKCLLAHAAKFAKKRYSTLAGFMEAGESAERAVVREVAEEVGIRVKNVQYCFSQSWPFPHSLMLGFFADYESGDIKPDGVEILEADWFSVDELPDLPPGFTTARRLIDRFLLQQGADIDQDSALFLPAE